jgi:hypothetical protein
LNAIISMPAKSAHARQAGQAFETEWGNSFPLTSRIITEYRQHLEKLGPRAKSIPAPTFLLKHAPSQEEALAPKKRRFWRDGITGTFKKETQRILQEETDWDKKGYLYFSNYKPPNWVGDHILLFDFVGDFLSENRIVATTHTLSRTPDGRDFVAYTPIPRKPKRKLTDNSLRFLKAILGLRSKDALQRRRKLSSKDADKLMDFLRTGRITKVG